MTSRSTSEMLPAVRAITTTRTAVSADLPSPVARNILVPRN